MSVTSRHPLYLEKLPDWEVMRDTYEGERKVKEMGVSYLPPTAGMVADGMKQKEPGYEAYEAYRTRAVFPDFVRQGIEGMLGMMHREPARIELPEALEGMRENATTKGESLQMLLCRMNENQLRYGRYGLLLEAPDGVDIDAALPFIATYDTLSIINWDDGRREQGRQRLEMVVLDETEFERDSNFQWNQEEKYRVLIMSEQVATEGDDDQSAPASGVYQAVILREGDTDFSAASPNLVTPSIGGREFEEIPFVMVNTKDLVTEPDRPPLLGLAQLSLTIYRGEADYRQALHMQGQETLVITGAKLDKNARVGAGAKIELPKDADAKFIGVTADGLSEMKDSLNDDKAQAGELTTKLFDDDSTQQSGEALRVRIASKTATLKTIAETSAEALAQILRWAAEWIGANPDEVVVEPNTDFAESTFTGQDMLQMIQSVDLGFPLSRQSLHRLAQKRDLTELDFEEEMAEIEKDIEEKMARMMEMQAGLGVPDDEQQNQPNPEQDEQVEDGDET